MSGPAVTAHLPPTVIMWQLLWNFRAVFPSPEAALCSFLNIIVIFRLKSTLFEMDEYPEAAFFNVGTIEDVKAKAETLK